MKRFEKTFGFSREYLENAKDPIEAIQKILNQYLEDADIQLEGPVYIDYDFESLSSTGLYVNVQTSGWYRDEVVIDGHCHNCGQLIRTMAFLGCEWCSENCHKALLRRG